MLCQICASIDLDEASATISWEEFLQRPRNKRSAFGYQHHASWSALEKAADEGCEMCQAFRSVAIDGVRRETESQLWLRIEKACHSIGLKLSNEGVAKFLSRLGVFHSSSHRWGSQKILTTVQSNLQAHCQQLSWPSLSKTFQDAIKVTRELGFRYLWIDSLCILQDSSDDWVKESEKMGSYYKDATLSIAASHPNSAEKGILAKRESVLFNGSADFATVVPCKSSHGVSNIYIRKQILSFEDMLDSKLFNPLELRGWVLQETMLAPRTLYFTQEQIIWHCRTCGQVEADRNPIFSASLPLNWTNPKAFITLNGAATPAEVSSEDTDQPLDAHGAWLRIVIDFCGRKLTYADDLFPAISGLAREVHRMTGDTYCAGLWRGDIARELMWYRQAPVKDTPKYLAPSWSWASKTSEVDGGMDPYFIIQNTRVVDGTSVEVIDVELEYATTDPFGKLKRGRIRVKGWTWNAYLSGRNPDTQDKTGKDETTKGDQVHVNKLDVRDDARGMTYSLDTDESLEEFLKADGTHSPFLALGDQRIDAVVEGWTGRWLSLETV
ncbi:HET domain-containing protein [Fusarium sp. LHS14.1]|nr:HET domain-containing protein [Fusarium sp. LHS14.1]